jgi:hypothetical protein
MIRSLTAFTFEIDNPDAAVAEILKQIDLSKLCKNSLGILTCYTEFLDTGVAGAVCKAMPFDVIGCTTAGSAVAGNFGDMMLSLMVMTSDDVFFTTGISGDLSAEQDAPIEAAYRKAAAAAPGNPAMILAFAPFIFNVGGEAIVESINKASGGILLFGALAIEATSDFNENQTIFNGTNSKVRLSFALLYGNIHPSFFIASIAEEKIQKQKGIITKSKGNILMEVNNMPVPAYLKSLGLREEIGSWETASFPFVLDYNDGTKPLGRSIYLITEDGCAACGGYMPENAAISLGAIDYADVLRTTGEAIQKILKNRKEASCLLMFACLTRYLVLGANTTAEMEKVRKLIAGAVDYQFAYAGGEICPVYTESGDTVNRFHNCTFIACLL